MSQSLSHSRIPEYQSVASQYLLLKRSECILDRVMLLTIGIGNVTTMPDKTHGFIVDLTKHGSIGSIGVGVSHVIDDGDRKRLGRSSCCSSLEGEDIRFRGAIAGGDLVVVCLCTGEVLDLHIVEVLTALRDGQQRAGRCAVISGLS